MSRRPLSAASSPCPRVPAPSSSSPSSAVVPTPRATQQSLQKYSRAAGVAPSPSSSPSSPSPSSSSAPPRSSASPRQPAGPSAPPSLKLVWVRDGEVQEAALAAGGVLTIGRARSCGVCLRHDGQVSNSHASIADGLLSDCGSTNGTTVNEQPVIRPHRLKLNDVIRCGNTELRIGQCSSQTRGGRSAESPSPGCCCPLSCSLPPRSLRVLSVCQRAARPRVRPDGLRRRASSSSRPGSRSCLAVSASLLFRLSLPPPRPRLLPPQPTAWSR